MKGGVHQFKVARKFEKVEQHWIVKRLVLTQEREIRLEFLDQEIIRNGQCLDFLIQIGNGHFFAFLEQKGLLYIGLN